MDSTNQNTLTYDCGIALKRIRGWLENELGLMRENGIYTFTCSKGSCRITAEPLENRTVGKVSLERTELHVTGNPEALDVFIHAFTLRFISAGG